MATVVELAEEMSRAFVGATRSDGSEFRKLRDGAPEWMTDVIHAGHADGTQGGMLPDDHRYAMVEAVCDAIAELSEDAGEDEIRAAVDEIEAPIYTHELTGWLHSRADRSGYCDEAESEFGRAEDMNQRLTLGYLQELRECGQAVLNALAERSEETESADRWEVFNDGTRRRDPFARIEQRLVAGENARSCDWCGEDGAKAVVQESDGGSQQATAFRFFCSFDCFDSYND